MVRTRIRLETLTDIQAFVNSMSEVPYEVNLVDDEGHCVNAKSMLGVMYSLEFKKVYCLSYADLGSRLLPYLIEQSEA